MKRLWRIFLGGTMLVLGACLASAFALAEDVVPSPLMHYGEFFRTITNFNDTSDSKCIGRPITPMCVLETYIAADLREDKELRAIALGERPGPPETFKDASEYNSAIYGYRVISVRLFPSQMVPIPERNRFKIQTGDVAITLEMNNCTYEPCTRGALNSDESYLFRKGEYGWYLVPAGTYRLDATDLCDTGLRPCSN